jgi:hypothetical protein
MSTPLEFHCVLCNKPVDLTTDTVADEMGRAQWCGVMFGPAWGEYLLLHEPSLTGAYRSKSAGGSNFPLVPHPL